MRARLTGLVAAILLLPLIVSFTYEAALLVASIVTLASVMWFLLGLVFFLLLYAVLLKGKITFLESLEHEMEHAAMAFLFSGQLPKRLEVNTDKESKVEVSDGLGCATGLAPYFLPLLTVPFLLLKALAALVFSFMDKPFSPFAAGAFDILIGVTFAFHLVGLFNEFSPKQTDLKKLGLVFSAVFVFFLNILVLLVILVVVTGTYSAVLPFLKSALVRIAAAYKTVFDFLRVHLLPGGRDLLKGVQKSNPVGTATPQP